MALIRCRAKSSTYSNAFTLIELLVVIAIIAILTAILLPVFAAVRENSRQGVSISNLKDIQQKMEQFKLDNHKYPDVLFGYAYPGSTMKTGLGMAQAAGNTPSGVSYAALYFPGLYPAYIKDPEEFTDPNNPVNSSDTTATNPVTHATTPSIVTGLATNLVAPCSPANDEILASATTTPATSSPCTAAPAGSIATTNRNYYLADAYDSNPQVTGVNTIGAASIVRYQVAREGTACTSTTPTLLPAGCVATVTSNEIYKHQLRWQNPPAETFITCSTYHVKNADKVLVLFESGAVKKMTGEEFATGVVGQTNSEPTNFWQLTP